MIKVKRAIVSVSDKRGLERLAPGLARHGVELLSTGGTARALRDAGAEPRQVSDYTGAPEILDGRVKTLHPKIHGGLLARDTDAHRAELDENDIGLIDMVVVNLYPFEKTVADPEVSRSDAVENIDIGGPTMLRAAAKNHERVAVVVDPDDYGAVVAELDENDGALSAATRARLARKAFAHTAGYDAAIAAYLSSVPDQGEGQRQTFPEVLTVQWRRVQGLRYGENPHQQAAFYADERWPLPSSGDRPTLARAEVLQGKELSYNNIFDLDAAMACCLEFDRPTAVVVKHTNPCGVASADTVAEAYRLARETDPTSSFGGIVASNEEVDAALAEQLAETFLECVVAPAFTDDARSVLSRKKNLRLVATGPWHRGADDAGWTVRSVAGGLLLQSADHAAKPSREAEVVTRRSPTDEELRGLDFAWKVVKHVKSNAIVYCRGERTVAIGAGQMSRVDSAAIAKMKAQLPMEGSVAASDAFFPFRDGLDTLAEAGATAVVQPGGSKRDKEVIAAADEHDVAMIFTGMRHFRH